MQLRDMGPLRPAFDMALAASVRFRLTASVDLLRPRPKKKKKNSSSFFRPNPLGTVS